ncbi:MAG: hypothetical protein E5W64_04585 [Mesorhizobium sp.]|uniref:hypothetical protein n=1 Tax=unclassified Mesorhizobium TaxID=325217 RepID=UPI0012182F8D|nr:MULTISPECIES: hypothetical protein [unclassified Mesorhizobium]TIT56112.1 MAG: hypothetical protein E5W64_04585 [Mesorhizobium sp.]
MAIALANKMARGIWGHAAEGGITGIRQRCLHEHSPAHLKPVGLGCEEGKNCMLTIRSGSENQNDAPSLTLAF